MSSTITPGSLCKTCHFVRRVHGRRGQTYLLCRNEEIEAKYPRQPVLTCAGYEPESGEPTSGGSSTERDLTS